MRVLAVAVVNSEGHIEHAYVPGTTYPENNSAWEHDNTKTIAHITSGFSDLSSFMQFNYYKDGKWKTRKQSPGPDYYDWKDEAWVLNSDRFWEIVRRERTGKLASCDWTQLDDCKLSLTKKEEWTEYRQALREVPATNAETKLLSEIVWPDQPSQKNSS